MASLLNNIRVLDLSRVLAGPWASQLLADYGAEVIKIEKPDRGDDTRHWGPPYLKDNSGQETQESAYFLSANRGKKSVVIDISTPQGQALIHSLAEKSDVLIENFKVGALEKYGLDYESLKKKVPGIIYCSITGYGQTGPYADKAGYDAMIQGAGGLMGITGLPDGHAGAGPIKTGVAVSDLMTGMYAVSAILAALYQRDSHQAGEGGDQTRSGVGQHIDLALLDTQVAWLANQGLNYLVSGQTPRREGNAHPNIVPYQTFATLDGHAILAIGNDDQFRRFNDILIREHILNDPLASDSRYQTNAQRVQNRDSLISTLEKVFIQKTTTWWLNTLEDADIPCGPINSVEQAFQHPQILHRKLQFELKHSSGVNVPMVKNPVVYSDSTLGNGLPPPLMGEHTEEVLSQLLGKTKPEVEHLRSKGVIK